MDWDRNQPKTRESEMCHFLVLVNLKVPFEARSNAVSCNELFCNSESRLLWRNFLFWTLVWRSKLGSVSTPINHRYTHDGNAVPVFCLQVANIIQGFCSIRSFSKSPAAIVHYTVDCWFDAVNDQLSCRNMQVRLRGTRHAVDAICH